MIILKIKKFFLLVIILFYCSECISSFDQEEYIGFPKFGTFCKHDLDEIHKELAQQEQNITTCNKDPKSNNIALGALTFIVSCKGNIEKKNYPINVLNENELSSKLSIFESRCESVIPFGKDLQKNFFLQEEVDDIAVVIGHVNHVWGRHAGNKLWQKSQNLRPREERIWADFESLQKKSYENTHGLKSEIIKYTQAINTLTSHLVDLSLSLSNLETEPVMQTDLVRKNYYKKKPSDIFTEIQENTKNSIVKIIKEKEKSFSQSVMGLYKYFWHSEQRLIHFLINSSKSDMWWENIQDDLADSFEEDYKILGVFLHVHSHFNFCDTCRYALARLSSEDSLLKSKISDRFSTSLNEKFFLNVLASFRVRWSCNFDAKKVWMPYDIHPDTQKIMTLDEFISKEKKNNVVFLKREILGADDEKESDEQL